MEYILIGDDCSYCSYLSNAFFLLKFAHKKIQVDLVNALPITNAISDVPDKSTIFLCHNIATQHHQQITEIAASIKKNIIACGQPDKLAMIKDSALHILKTPFTKYELKNILALCHNSEYTQPDINHPVFEKLVGPSKVIFDLKSMILKVAHSDSTVLILGHSGTGKDVIASCIHQLSERKAHPFVPINCGAIPSELMESELFGHEKGSFTGASARRTGRFEYAHNGTLFFDEVGDMPLPMQVKLLRVLQEKKIERIGGNNVVDVNVRLIAATNKDLEKMIQQNEFREDLYYRLNVFPIHVPNLKDRKEDIPYIIDYQLNKIAERIQHRVVFTDQALEVLCEYAWPGNIRELQNFLERMVILYPDEVVCVNKLDLKITKKLRKKKSVCANEMPI